MSHFIMTDDFIYDHMSPTNMIPGDIFRGSGYSFPKIILDIYPEENGKGHYIKVQERIYPNPIYEWRHVPSDGIYTMYPRRDIVTQFDGETILATERHLLPYLWFADEGWWYSEIVQEGKTTQVRFHKATRTWYLASLVYPPVERQVDIQIALAGPRSIWPGQAYYEQKFVFKEDLIKQFWPCIGLPLSSISFGPASGEQDSWIIEEIFARQESYPIYAKIAPPKEKIQGVPVIEREKKGAGSW